MDFDSSKLFFQNDTSFSITNSAKEKPFKIDKISKDHYKNSHQINSKLVEVGVQTEDFNFNLSPFQRNLFGFMNPFNVFRNNTFLQPQQKFLFSQKNLISEKQNNLLSDPVKLDENIKLLNSDTKLNTQNKFNLLKNENLENPLNVKDELKNNNSININYNYFYYSQKSIIPSIFSPQQTSLQNNQSQNKNSSNVFLPFPNKNDILTPKIPPFFSNPFTQMPEISDKKMKPIFRKKFIKKRKELSIGKLIIIDEKQPKIQKNDSPKKLINKSNEETDKKCLNNKNNEINEIKHNSINSNSSEDNILSTQIDSTIIDKIKGRKKKDSERIGKHTKYSTDNMMRKIKNKVLEYCRSLINKILSDDIIEYNELKKKNSDGEKSNDLKNGINGLRKIKGLISQELNVKFNFWFYLLKISEIFSFELSGKYSNTNKNSNKNLINFLFNEKNNKYFIKTKSLLNMPFHQFYHDIFLNENKEWKKKYGIAEDNNNYQLEHLLKGLEKGEPENYHQKIYDLAHEYEEFFLIKRPRNSFDVDRKKEKKEIHIFIHTFLDEKYDKLFFEVKKFKDFYYERKAIKEGTFLKSDICDIEIKK